MALTSASAITSLLKGMDSYSQGFGFGAGYGSGVRFGYSDLYPALREGLSKIPFFGTGFESAQEQKNPIKPQPLSLPKWW
jgi:hypothetical protein